MDYDTGDYKKQLRDKELDLPQLKRKQIIIRRVFKKLQTLPTSQFKEYINNNIPSISKEVFNTLDTYEQFILSQLHDNNNKCKINHHGLIYKTSTISIIISIIVGMYIIFK